jgi:PKD repeat protein
MKRCNPQLLTAMLAIFLISCSKMTPVVDQVQTGGTTRGTMPSNPNVHPFLNINAHFTYSAILNNFHSPAGFIFTSSTSPSDSIWWDFGDGIGDLNTVNPSHIYTKPGIYTVIERAKFGPRTTADTQRITVLNALYARFVVDSISAEVITSNRPDTVYFTIADSGNNWESERFALPPSSSGTTTQSFPFQHPDTISQLGNHLSIVVIDDYRREPYYVKVQVGRGETRGVGLVDRPVPWTNIIFDEISPFSLIGYPTVLQNKDMTLGGELEFKVYLTWK